MTGVDCADHREHVARRSFRFACGTKALEGVDAAAVPDSSTKEAAVSHVFNDGSKEAMRGVRFWKELQQRCMLPE